MAAPAHTSARGEIKHLFNASWKTHGKQGIRDPNTSSSGLLEKKISTPTTEFVEELATQVRAPCRVSAIMAAHSYQVDLRNPRQAVMAVLSSRVPKEVDCLCWGCYQAHVTE